MAICDICKQDMSNKVSCIKTFFDNIEAVPNNEEQCPDCACPPNGYHHPGCDKEECPLCGGQAIGCDCEYENCTYEEDDLAILEATKQSVKEPGDNISLEKAKRG